MVEKNEAERIAVPTNIGVYSKSRYHVMQINIFTALFCCFTLITVAQQKDFVAYASTLQGSNSEYALSSGNTHPSTALPFGMHAWSAQTGKNGDGWKYQYKANTIRGFQQTHQCR